MPKPFVAAEFREATHRFVGVRFHHFKAFESFTLALRHFNVLVGPNNSGKSTILAAFRILAAAMRRATTRSPTVVHGPVGKCSGYNVDLQMISVAEENIFFNYDDTEPATVLFTLSNGNTLLLYFPVQGACVLIPDAQGHHIANPSKFRRHFNCTIGFVPILGPVEHHEPLFEKEAARRALFNYKAARNFRNIWYHFPDLFENFRDVLAETWPGMDVTRPTVDMSHGKARLHMFCPEERLPREIFWAGFGFQVWCQMLTHLIQSSETSIFLIDEPDIYLHSDLQRQLLGLLRNLGPDILIATHSTEIISETEPDDIVLISKHRKVGKRVKNVDQLSQVFSVLGSSINPVLTQVAKTRRVLFVEGQDFQILGKFARRLGKSRVGSRADFAVIPIHGFSVDRIRSVIDGIKSTLGTPVQAAAILDRDYRSQEECDSITKDGGAICHFMEILDCKEIENFLLIPGAIDRAAKNKIVERASRGGDSVEYTGNSASFLDAYAAEKRSYVTAQLLENAKRFKKQSAPSVHPATVTEKVLEDINQNWKDDAARLRIIPGKDALSALNQHFQKDFGISVTNTAIIDAMKPAEVPQALKTLIERIASFSKLKPL
jgi:energy-coupling factor transporter ATP-binding protein EcfA2